MLWAYLARATSDPSAADDLLQEAYYRLLRATTTFESDEHRKNYLFRIATNLIRDRFRRPESTTPNCRNMEQDTSRLRATSHSRRSNDRISPARWRSSASGNASWCGSRTDRVNSSGNRGGARIEDGEHQAAPVSRAPESLPGFWHHETARLSVRQTRLPRVRAAPRACGSRFAASSSTRSNTCACRRRRSSGGELRCARGEKPARTAARPIVFTQALAVAALVGLLVSVVGHLTLPVMAWPGFLLPDGPSGRAHRNRRGLLAHHCAGGVVLRILPRLIGIYSAARMHQERRWMMARLPRLLLIGALAAAIAPLDGQSRRPVRPSIMNGEVAGLLRRPPRLALLAARSDKRLELQSASGRMAFQDRQSRPTARVTSSRARR